MMRAGVACLTLCIVSPGPQSSAPEGYEWQDLGQGVYLHTRANPLAGPVDGNSVVIVNDADVIVVDTHIDPAAARALITRIRSVTDHPVSHVINTHWHDDHTNGNHAFQEAFPGVRFLAHPATIAALRREWQPMEDQRRDTYASVEGRDILAAAASLEATDPQQAIGLRLFVGYRDALEPELPTLELVYPDTPVDSTWVFERGGRRIVVESVGPGNTDGDLVVWLPEASILITGDILVAPVPFAFDAPMLDWPTTLRRINAYDAGVLVPGHGRVMEDSEYLHQVISLIEETVDAVRGAYANGVSYEDLVTAIDLSARETQFTQGDPERTYAWSSYFRTPGLQSAWKSLGYPVP